MEFPSGSLNPVIHESLNSLPGRCGAVLNYYYLEKLTREEIAEKFNLTPQRISQIKDRGLRILRHTRFQHLRFAWYILTQITPEEKNLLFALFEPRK